MMEKKRMAALLAAVLFGMSAIPAGAVNLIDTDTAATDSAEHAELDLYGVRATVTDRQDGELTVSTETAGTVVVHIAEQTIIMDTQTGLPAGAQDIKKGDEVYLYCGEMMALSEPPHGFNHFRNIFCKEHTIPTLTGRICCTRANTFTQIEYQ